MCVGNCMGRKREFCVCVRVFVCAFACVLSKFAKVCVSACLN